MNSDKTNTQRKFCSAILAGKDRQPYKKYVKIAEDAVCTDIQDKKIRENIINAIELNLINYKKNPFEALRRKYNLPISATEFCKEKKLFCNALSKESGMTRKNSEECNLLWTKDDILNMLYSIADEANECIVKEDGVFNHQVAGVALKAIDQAVKLCGMCEKEKAPDDSAYIEMDDTADAFGA